MITDVMTVPEDLLVSKLITIMKEEHHTAFPVLKKNSELKGIVTFQDLSKVPDSLLNKVYVHEIMSNRMITAYEDETLYVALQRINQANLRWVLVVDRETPRQLKGIITQTDILHVLQSNINPNDNSESHNETSKTPEGSLF
jgi:CBS domain-containing protein